MVTADLGVMVVEDHGFQRRMALHLLAELGILNAHEAADGATALILLAQLPHPPDLLLVDLDMPGMDGVELIGHVAKRRLARTVVLVSALSPVLLNTVQTMARAYGLRVLGNIEKPLTLEKLHGMLTNYDDTFADEPDDPLIEFDIDTLREALLRGEIVPWFQPQVEFGNGKVIAVEALARWVRSDGSVVKPHNFVAKLESEGLAQRLADSILDQACQWKQRWDQQDQPMRIAVNISPATLADPDAADRYHEIVRAHHVDPSDVTLEITESSLMSDPASSLGVLARLRLKGFGLSIDDFGTGYSSLAQLSQIPFTELKIDKGFVTGAHKQPRKRAVVEASLDLARKLELHVVAEGVETVEDWRLLSDLGCSVAQGYLIAQPMPGDALPEAIAHWRRRES